MYITLEADYAVRILVYLCQNQSRTDAGTIAQATNVTPRFALKILRKLVMGGILKSYKGIHGGYTLAKKPEKITLLQVIELMEGRYRFSRCLNKAYRADHWCRESDCKVRRVYSQVSVLVRDHLKGVTFDQLM